MNARKTTPWNPIVCDAIARRVLLAFDYDGEPRVVAPYCHGVTTAGRETVRAVQVLGGTRRGDIASGKLWTIDKIVGLRALDESFIASDPKYNPDDSAFAEIHCRIDTRKTKKR